MELVYLWIEKFRKIEMNGYSFSNKFKVEIKEDTSVNEKEIFIGSIENVCPCFDEDNAIINITSLVGYNGTGKTTILNCIYDLFAVANEATSTLVYYDNQRFWFLSSNMKIKNTTEYEKEKFFTQYEGERSELDVYKKFFDKISVSYRGTDGIKEFIEDYNITYPNRIFLNCREDKFTDNNACKRSSMNDFCDGYTFESNIYECIRFLLEEDANKIFCDNINFDINSLSLKISFESSASELSDKNSFNKVLCIKKLLATLNNYPFSYIFDFIKWLIDSVKDDNIDDFITLLIKANEIRNKMPSDLEQLQIEELFKILTKNVDEFMEVKDTLNNPIINFDLNFLKDDSLIEFLKVLDER